MEIKIESDYFESSCVWTTKSSPPEPSQPTKPDVYQSTLSPQLSSTLEVEEIDIKMEIKMESDKPNKTNHELKIQEPRFVMCGCHVPFLVICPACDISFKGGLARLPCVTKHISSVHQRNKKKLLKIVSTSYRRKVLCRCLAMRTTYDV